MSPKLWSTALLTAVLLSLPLFAVLQQRQPDLWDGYLAWPAWRDDIPRHTPYHRAGYALPAEINGHLVLAPDDGPIILSGTTRIAPPATLILEPGTTMYANEFAALVVAGQLEVRGTLTAPVRITSNEQHPANRVWSGIIFTPHSRGTLAHADVSFGSPAVTCLPDSQVAVAASTLRAGSLGVFAESSACTVTASRITGARDGIIAVNVEPSSSDTVIAVQRAAIRKFSNYVRTFQVAPN